MNRGSFMSISAVMHLTNASMRPRFMNRGSPDGESAVLVPFKLQ